MRYPVAIHKDQNSCYGVSVPDIPGCFSAGETYDDALNNVEEAISSHLEILAEDGKIAPQATTIEQWQHHSDYTGASWALVQIDISAFLGKTEKATITLPKLLMTRIDEFVKSGKAKNRSAFLTDSAIKALESK